MSSPTIVSASSTTVASGTSITINAPSSISSGNLLIAVVATTSTSTLATPSDWTLLTTAAGGEASYYKIASNNEPSNYTWTWTTSSVGCGLIVQVTGNSVMPLDAYGGQANASSANITAPSVTPRPKTDLLVNIYASNTANTITVPASQNNIGGTTGNSRAIICGYQTLADTYATGTVTSNGTNVSNNDTVTIGGKVYTFKTTLTPAEGEILIGATATDSLTNLSRAINNSGGTPGTDYQVAAESAWVTCSAVVSLVITLTSIGPGTAGNSTTLAKSAATLTVSGGVLSGAVNGNDATGTKVATGTAAVNYGFSFAIKEPTVVGSLLPTDTVIGLNRTNYPYGPVKGIGAGPKMITSIGTIYGRYKIEGYTRQITSGTALARYALLYDIHGRPVYGQRTKITESGFFSFKNIAAGDYIVIGLDESGVQNGVIAYKITAVAM